MRVIKPYSPIAWFVVLNTSFEGPKTGLKSDQVYPEHLSTSYMGAEADDWPTLSLINRPHRRQNFKQTISIILHIDFVS